VVEAIERMESDVAETTSDLVRVGSVSPNYPGCIYDDLVGGETEANRRLAPLYEEAGARVEWIEVVPGRANLVAVIPGTGGGRSLAFGGHIDTVPAGDPARWTGGDPWSGRIEGGRVHGRGAADQKGGLVAVAMAAVALRRAGVRLLGDLVIESAVGEEVGDHDAGIGPLVERYPVDGCVITEPTAAVGPDPHHPPRTLLVAPITAGLLWMTLEVEGRAGHNNLRPHVVRAGGVGEAAGVNAIEKGVYLLEALQHLEQQWGQRYSHPLFGAGHFSLHPGVIIGGPHGALVPFFSSEFCRIEYSILYPPQVGSGPIKEEIEAFLKDASRLDPWLRKHGPSVMWNLDWEPAMLDPEHPLCTLLARVRREATGETPWTGEGLDPAIRAFDAVCDATTFMKAGIPTVICGPGSIQFAHAVDESVSIAELVTAAKLYALAAMDWCGVAEA
jgi:acetylornithine deacetylase/succinyl-diaminopimelate desuccinylase-like protein